MTSTTEIHPVDQILPTPRLLALGLQQPDIERVVAELPGRVELLSRALS